MRQQQRMPVWRAVVVLAMSLPLVACDHSGFSTSPAGAGAADRSASDNRGEIVCTTGMVADLVRHVVGDAGDSYDVVSLMSEGVDPHLYKPTTSDTARLQDAAIIFYNGLMLEGPMDRPLRTLARQKPVFAVTESLPPDRLRTNPDFAGHPDPHVWMDVSLWSQAVDAVCTRMSEVDPDNADAYQENARRYQQELARLDEYARTAIASIPRSQRYLVTAHDAFSYFGKAYDIPVESVQGITTESEPGVNDVIRLADLLVTKKIPALFVESSVNSDNIRAVLESAEGRGWPARLGGTLYSDAMGPSGTYLGTYVGMIDHNITMIASTLGGAVPPTGLNGQLSVGD